MQSSPKGHTVPDGVLWVEANGSSNMALTVANGLAGRLLCFSRDFVIVLVFEIPVVTIFAFRSAIFTAVAQVVQRAWWAIVYRRESEHYGLVLEARRALRTL